MYLLDTDVLSNLLSKRPSARLLGRLGQVPAEHQFTSAITVGELYYGIHKSPRGHDYQRRLERSVWPRVKIVPFDRASAEIYGRLRADLERLGRPLPDADLMIASVGLARKLVVVTGNVRHFSRVDGLKVENWM
jgi:predicted nucleic acid-binding protein